MDKSPEAFRTISEVAETLETPAHVLRFWESRFPQIRPVKRAGGRRYYRPADVALLSGIRHLLHDEGMTIRGVQKILREQGVRHVASLGADGALIEAEDDLGQGALLEGDAREAPEATGAEIVELEPAPRATAPRDGAPGEVLHLHSARPPAPSAPEVEAAPAPAATKAEPEPAPEARHVWVEDEPEFDLLAPTPLFAEAKAAPVPEPGLEGLFEGVFLDQAPEPLPKLAGLAARIRALPRPLSPHARAELEELHSRLGLLHAQMAEAMRMRR